MPALPPVVDRIEDVPEPARTFYVQKDGKFHVDLSGAPVGFVPQTELQAANAKVIEFRDNNIALNKKVSELEPQVAKFTGIDPEAAKAAIAAQKALQDKGVKSADDISTIVQTAVNAAVQPLQEQITSFKSTAEAEKKKSEDLLLRGTLGEKFIKAGGEPNALNFIVNEARGVFVVDNETIKAAAGQYSTDRPGEPLTIDEWLTRETKQNSFAFKPSGGGGGVGNPKPGETGGVTLRPGQTILKDPTPAELGAASKDILAGKVKVVYTEKAS